MPDGTSFQTFSCGIVTPPTSSKWEKRAFGIPVLPNAPSTQIAITEAIRVLHTVEVSHNVILAQMQALAKTLPEYSLAREMPCIGDTLAPRLIAEVGDVRRFHSKRTLIAYAGIDAPPYQSGKFRANSRHISKRGNRYLSKTGYDDGKVVLHCPVGHKPLRCRYVLTAKQARAYFPYDLCAGCPHLEQCHPKLNKVTGLIAISRSAIEKARQQRHMAEDDFQNWKRVRIGVETIPSTLRNQYHVDDMPVRGRIPSKFFFGAKISAINFKKLLRQRRGLYCCPHNPLLT